MGLKKINIMGLSRSTAIRVEKSTSSLIMPGQSTLTVTNECVLDQKVLRA